MSNVVSDNTSSVILSICFLLVLRGFRPLRLHCVSGVVNDCPSLTRLGITPVSSVWIGAWWVGFILSAVLCLVVAVPLLAFPYELPGESDIIQVG